MTRRFLFSLFPFVAAAAKLPTPTVTFYKHSSVGKTTDLDRAVQFTDAGSFGGGVMVVNKTITLQGNEFIRNVRFDGGVRWQGSGLEYSNDGGKAWKDLVEKNGRIARGRNNLMEWADSSG